MKKSQTGTISIYLFLFFIQKTFYFIKKLIWKSLVCLVTFVLQFFHMVVYLKCSNETPTLIQICTGFVEAVLRPNIFSNRQGILTQILIAIDYLMNCFYISEKYLTFTKKQKHLLGIFLVHPIQVNESIYCGIVFQTMYTSKICT